MKTASTDNTLLRPIGVVLAGSPNLHLWPHSRSALPVQFVRGQDGLSAFQTALLRVQKVSLAARPLVTVPSSCLTIARDQIAELEFGRPPQILVEPVYRGSFASMAYAALHAGRQDRTALMVMIDAHRPPMARDAFDNLTSAMRAASQTRRRIVVGVEPYRAEIGEPRLALKAGAKVGQHHLFEASGQDVPQHLSPIARSGLVFATPRVCLQGLSAAESGMVDGISMALQNGAEARNEVWPQINLWSALAHRQIEEVLPIVSDYIFLRPVDLGHWQRREEAPLGNETHRIRKLGGSVVVFQNCPNIDVVSTDDAMLVRPKGQAFDAEGAMGALRAAKLPHGVTTGFEETPWGDTRLVDAGPNHEAHLLRLAPRQRIPEHLHYHRSESWTLLAGKATVWLDGEPQHVGAGRMIRIERNVIHGIENTGDQPLILMESRYGERISPADIVRTRRDDPDVQPLVKAYSAGARPASPP